jgi:hypothetical protein
MTALDGYTSDKPSIQCENLVVTGYASLPGGAVIPGNAIGGAYTALGTENPAGFALGFSALATPIVPPPAYVAIVMVYSARGFIQASTNPTTWTGSQVTVQTSVQLDAGDVVVVLLAPT